MRNFHWVKDLKSLAEYLRPEPTAADKRDAAAAKVAAMLGRLEKKGG